jgi:hypothetical protein
MRRQHTSEDYPVIYIDDVPANFVEIPGEGSVVVVNGDDIGDRWSGPDYYATAMKWFDDTEEWAKQRDALLWNTEHDWEGGPSEALRLGKSMVVIRELS